MEKQKETICEDKFRNQIVEMLKEQEKECEELNGSLAHLCEQLRQQEKDMYENITKNIRDIPNTAIVPDYLLSQSPAKQKYDGIRYALNL